MEPVFVLNFDMVKSKGWSVSWDERRTCEGGGCSNIGISSRFQKFCDIKSIVLLLMLFFLMVSMLLFVGVVGEGVVCTHLLTDSLL